MDVCFRRHRGHASGTALRCAKEQNGLDRILHCWHALQCHDWRLQRLTITPQAMIVDRTFCYICCGPGADSDDHVIPECFFTPPKPPNLLKLRAHYSCHNRLPEEFVRNLFAGLSAGDAASATAQSLWGGAVTRAYQRNAPLREEVLAGLVRSEDVYSPGRIYLGTTSAICFDPERVYPALRKMVRGLYLHHTGSLLPQNVVFRWRPNEVLYGRGREYFEASAPGLAYDDVFECRYLFARETGLEASLWWLRFYRATVFRCFVAPRPNYPRGAQHVTERGGNAEGSGRIIDSTLRNLLIEWRARRDLNPRPLD